MQAPGGADDLSLLGFWRSGGRLYTYRPHHFTGGDAAGDYVAFYAMQADGKAEPRPAWVSPRLSGKVLNILPGPDIRNEKRCGFYVLVEGANENGSTLYYFNQG